MPHLVPHSTVGVADYEPLVGAETIERLRRKAAVLHDVHVVHVN